MQQSIVVSYVFVAFVEMYLYKYRYLYVMFRNKIEQTNFDLVNVFSKN